MAGTRRRTSRWSAEDGRLLAAVRGPTSSHQAVGAGGGHGAAGERSSPRPVAGRRGSTERADVGGLLRWPAPTRRPMSGCSPLRSAHSRVRGRATSLRNDTFGGAARRHGSGLGRRRDLRRRASMRPGSRPTAGRRGSTRSGRSPAIGAAATDVGWAGLGGGGPGTRRPWASGQRWSGRCRRISGCGSPRGPDAGDVRRPDRRAADRRAVARSCSPRRRPGDPAARAIVDRLADEIVAMAGAMIRRLRLTRLRPGRRAAGGVFRTRDDGFWDRIADGVGAIAPRARLVRSPPRRWPGRPCSGWMRWSAGSRILDRGRRAVGAGGLGRQGDEAGVEGRQLASGRGPGAVSAASRPAPRSRPERPVEREPSPPSARCR